MFRNTSAAIVVWATLTLSAQAIGPAAPAPQPQPITTQQAFQSWLAWYQLHPQAPADVDGPRFLQLLSAADGDLYFLSGLDDASPQVRELSKQGLIESLSGRSYVELTARLHDSKADVRRQAQEILDASPDSHGIATIVAFVESAKAWKTYGAEAANPPEGDDREGACLDASWSHDPSQLGLEFQWGVPFGGLMRVALASHAFECRPYSTELPDSDIDAEVVRLTKAVYDLAHGSRYIYGGEIEHLRRQLVEAERRQARHTLLQLLDQTIQYSPLDDALLAKLKETLAELPSDPVAAADQSTGDFSGSPLWRRPTYCARIELERRAEAQPTGGDHACRQAAHLFTTAPAIPNDMPYVHNPGQLDGDIVLTVGFGARGVAEQCVVHVVPPAWTSHPAGEPQALAPGTYKALLTFAPPADVPFGYDGTKIWPRRFGAIVFRVHPETSQAIGSGTQSKSLAESSVSKSARWQILAIAISDSTLVWDDLCVPVPSTFTQPESDRDQLINFSMSSSR